jgi:hypothetical protein
VLTVNASVKRRKTALSGGLGAGTTLLTALAGYVFWVFGDEAIRPGWHVDGLAYAFAAGAWGRCLAAFVWTATDPGGEWLKTIASRSKTNAGAFLGGAAQAFWGSVLGLVGFWAVDALFRLGYEDRWGGTRKIDVIIVTAFTVSILGPEVERLAALLRSLRPST